MFSIVFCVYFAVKMWNSSKWRINFFFGFVSYKINSVIRRFHNIICVISIAKDDSGNMFFLFQTFLSGENFRRGFYFKIYCRLRDAMPPNSIWIKYLPFKSITSMWGTVWARLKGTLVLWNWNFRTTSKGRGSSLTFSGLLEKKNSSRGRCVLIKLEISSQNCIALPWRDVFLTRLSMSCNIVFGWEKTRLA